MLYDILMLLHTTHVFHIFTLEYPHVPHTLPRVASHTHTVSQHSTQRHSLTLKPAFNSLNSHHSLLLFLLHSLPSPLSTNLSLSLSLSSSFVVLSLLFLSLGSSGFLVHFCRFRCVDLPPNFMDPELEPPPLHSPPLSLSPRVFNCVRF